jgi:hypothetical protein
MSKPLKTAQYAAGAAQFRDAVNAYREERGSAPNPVPTKPKRPRVPLERPTEIKGFPLNDSLPQDIPDYGSIARVTAMQEQRRERQRKIGALRSVKPIGEPQLIKRTAK